MYTAPVSLFEEEGGEELVVPMETFKILEQVHLAALLQPPPPPPPPPLLTHPIPLRSMKRA